jgi:catechol 2,3-dioxygenase-like lactoylglutathione lyase family enzyme
MATKTKARTTKGKAVGKAGTRARRGAKRGSKALSLDRLGYAIVFVRDMDRGVAFYRDVLGIPVRFADGEWSEFEMKGLTLALHRADAMPKNLDQAPIPELCFKALDVGGTRAELVRRGVKVSELRCVCEMGNHVGASASFRDPDGNHLSIFGMVPKSQWSGPRDGD